MPTQTQTHPLPRHRRDDDDDAVAAAEVSRAACLAGAVYVIECTLPYCARHTPAAYSWKGVHRRTKIWNRFIRFVG